jgi:hypothetical protein
MGGAICVDVMETVDHLLLHCSVASNLWNFVYRSFGIQWAISGKVMDLLFGWRNWFGKHSSGV